MKTIFIDTETVYLYSNFISANYFCSLDINSKLN